MIPESNPTEIFKARVNINASMSLTLAPPEHNHTFFHVGGILSVTDQLYEAFTKTGHRICCIFKEKSWKNAINKADYYKQRDFTLEIPEDLAGEISCHGLMPLQSKKEVFE